MSFFKGLLLKLAKSSNDGSTLFGSWSCIEGPYYCKLRFVSAYLYMHSYSSTSINNAYLIGFSFLIFSFSRSNSKCNLTRSPTFTFCLVRCLLCLALYHSCATCSYFSTIEWFFFLDMVHKLWAFCWVVPLIASNVFSWNSKLNKRWGISQTHFKRTPYSWIVSWAIVCEL